MNRIEVKDIVIGEGKPKIALSICESTKEEILKTAKKIDTKKVDLVEWRVDFFSHAFEMEKVLDVLKSLREIFQNTPIIFTFRSKKEGGEREISIEEYIHLNIAIAESKLVDFIDLEVFSLSESAKDLIEILHRENILVIGSYHNFSATPSEDDMVQILRNIESSRADILKLAVMGNTSEDVLELLNMTNRVEKYIKSPIITISMGELGKLSRISGEIFPSCITFAALDKSSAPGQIHVDLLFDILNM